MVAAALRGVFAGAGVAMFGEPAVVNAVISLASKPAPSDINLLYLGTATYDLPKFRDKQTAAFAERGVQVSALDVACTTPPESKVSSMIESADVILVSGGNTLFAVDRWQRAGMVEPLRQAALRGAVLCGGSAGAGCWFDALHSDSMDPDWYRGLMLAGGGAAAEKGPAEASAPSAAKAAWEYVRVPCLGFLPGLFCPHYDRVQSNGVLRATDFDGMLARHPGETGLAIDHFAALVISAEQFELISLPDKPGSVMPDGSSQPGEGTPGAWLMGVGEAGRVVRALPARGSLSELLTPARDIQPDPRVEVARQENPSEDL